METLKGKVLFITGASRGIGKAIALRAARDGARILIAPKTAEPHPKLPGTIYTAAKEIEAAGGQALPLVVDIRFEGQIAEAVEKTVATFGGIDICVNNASAISLTGTLETPMKRFDLMHSINTRGTFATSQACIPHLKKAKNPHILNLSPPLTMSAKWFQGHVAYSMAKYGMSMCVIGMAVNALWPRTTIATAAIEMVGGQDMMRQSRKPEIVADAAYEILQSDSRTCTGNFFLDEDLLRSRGVTDFEQYAMEKGVEPLPDYFID